MINRRNMILSGAAVLAAAPKARALAQPYPSRPITIVVPYAAGGATDVIARLIGQQLQQRFGGSVVVENKPGATTAIGTQYVARSEPDGHTLLMTAPPFVIGRYATPKPSYDSTRDFAPISLATISPLVIAVSAKLPVKSMPEFIAYARGQNGALNYGSTGLKD
jgi:tripartite-type tricarboxylate transporter receptor subunit TctC